MQIILWATDGSESAYAAGKMVQHLKTGFPEAKVIALYVREVMAYPPQALVPSGFEDLDQNEQRNVERQIHDLFGNSHDVELVVVEGHASTTIAEVAERYGADVIVVGSHGYHGFDRLVLGSVSRQLLDHTVRPVLVVR
ncbi:Nucleotide-binding universal stress protein, UspA family [Sulfobacillus thermosulfidooxidans DSM 9293]|uniref:Nucleotide-binding universal stress protein, UspA family n=2 Tax=Sulfobacillus thermosulfidooxidans TaxID=28034 RepID=A0A1W1WDF3_SULTA|nr:universal stress protein [Sulfobacillus thermosulfidooxidans]PSR29060.1 MAG: universal stress protein [Sulfobacillus thermosulfidooxidans]SMC04199.1 Nucleotide-binding universal stress protein, UspA family [Sulfobacillus thermosulfidooxidans DSM 9293]